MFLMLNHDLQLNDNQFHLTNSRLLAYTRSNSLPVQGVQSSLVTASPERAWQSAVNLFIFI